MEEKVLQVWAMAATAPQAAGAGAGWVDVANDLVKNFLGRPQNMAAFQKWMGEKFETRKLCTSLVTQTRGSFFPFRRLVFVRLCRGLKEHR